MTYETKFAPGDTAYYCYIREEKVVTEKYKVKEVIIAKEEISYRCVFEGNSGYQQVFPERSLCLEREADGFELKYVVVEIANLKKRLDRFKKRKEELLNGE